MISVGLLARLEAKAGKEQEVADFLASAQPMAVAEVGTLAWFAIRLSPTTFGIFDVFPDETGRKAHLSGPIASALMQRTDLFAEAPKIEQVDVIAHKL